MEILIVVFAWAGLFCAVPTSAATALILALNLTAARTSFGDDGTAWLWTMTMGLAAVVDLAIVWPRRLRRIGGER